MGDISKAVFEREQLPKTAIIRAGGYYPGRSKLLLDKFESVEELRFEWCPYTYATYQTEEYLVVFNVYGGAVTLEVLRILKEGGVENVLFIGSMFSKNLDIGQFTVITEVLDRAGLVQIDTGKNTTVSVKEEYIQHLEQFYQYHKIDYHKARIMSVPCVLHGIEHLHQELSSDDTLEGVEMELSTLYHFGQKLDLSIYSFLYISDNSDHHMMTTDLSIRELRLQQMNLLGELMLKFSKSI
jgi:purine-nucleoside phosphorylase